MARLMLDKWPGRNFQDAYFAAPGCPTLYAYVSQGDETGGPHANAVMLALDLSYATPKTPDATVAAMMRSGQPPFLDVEEIKIGPGRYLVARIDPEAISL